MVMKLIAVAVLAVVPAVSFAQSKPADDKKPAAAQPQVRMAPTRMPQRAALVPEVELGRFTALPEASAKLARLDPAVASQLVRESMERPRRLGVAQWSQGGDSLFLSHPRVVSAGGARMVGTSSANLVLNTSPGYRYLVDCSVLDTPRLYYFEQVSGEMGMPAAVEVPVRDGLGAFVVGPYERRQQVTLAISGQVTAPASWQFQACEVTPIRSR